MTKTFPIVLALLLTACSGALYTSPAPSRCDGAPSPAACEQCLAHPPLGEVGDPICQTAVDAPAGSTCCSVAKADGSCEATYVDDGREFVGRCGSTR